MKLVFIHLTQNGNKDKIKFDNQDILKMLKNMYYYIEESIVLEDLKKKDMLPMN